MTYAKCMTIAMDMSRYQNLNDDSLIDLETSMYVEPLSALSTQVSDELNASRQFEQLLCSQLQSEVPSGSPIPSKHVNAYDLSPDDTEQESLLDIVRKEADDSKAFEEFLHKSLLEEA